MGAFVLANEAGLFVAPTLYGPAGGLSGRSTLAVIVWLVAWGLLHARWRGRDVRAGGVIGAAVLLILLGLVGTFPPVWELL
jgi:hypothetical protein